MSRIIDNVLAYKILRMLITPFIKTPAFRLGIIDARGKILKHSKDLTTAEEKDAYNYLNRLVFNLKRLINKLPGGENYLKSLVAALFLIKESYETYNTTNIEMRFNELVEAINTNDISLIEETIIVQRFLEDGAIANVTGAGIANPELPLSVKKKPNKILKRKVI